MTGLACEIVSIGQDKQSEIHLNWLKLLESSRSGEEPVGRGAENQHNKNKMHKSGQFTRPLSLSVLLTSI